MKVTKMFPLLLAASTLAACTGGGDGEVANPAGAEKGAASASNEPTEPLMEKYVEPFTAQNINHELSNGVDEKRIFYPSTSQIMVPTKFENDKEVFVRGGLPNFFSKVKAGKEVTIAYLGGSITMAEGYRVHSAKWIQDRYKVKVKGVNAGVSGTGTELGAARTYEHVIQYKPDLVFIEFAVNRGAVEALEGIIRQIWMDNPKTDICLLYSAQYDQAHFWREGKTAEYVASMEKVANYYGIPSIQMALEPALLEGEGKLVYKGSADVKDKIVFSLDGIHPTNDVGALYYAGSIARAFGKMDTTANEKVHDIAGGPLHKESWDDATILEAKKTKHTNGWKVYDQPEKFPPYIYTGETPGESLEFNFFGNRFGLYSYVGPDSGQILVTIDDAKPIVYNLFDNNSNAQGTRFRYFDVPYGAHSVKIEMSKEKPDKAKILREKGEEKLSDFKANPQNYVRNKWNLLSIIIKGTVIRDESVNLTKVKADAAPMPREVK